MILEEQICTRCFWTGRFTQAIIDAWVGLLELADSQTHLLAQLHDFVVHLHGSLIGRRASFGDFHSHCMVHLQELLLHLFLLWPLSSWHIEGLAMVFVLGQDTLFASFFLVCSHIEVEHANLSLRRGRNWSLLLCFLSINSCHIQFVNWKFWCTCHYCFYY